jgi:hypothetical protein
MLSEAILTARGWLFWALLFWTPLHSLAVRWPRVFFRIEIALVGYAADWGYRRERRAALQAQGVAMSDDNVVELKLLTTINLPPERILNAALEADLAALVIVGYDKNGEYYFHSSIPHGATINWLLDQCKKRIIDEPSDMRGEPGTEEQTDDR